MALEQIIEYGCELTHLGHVQVWVDTSYRIDGTLFGPTRHRHVLSPGDDLSGQYPDIAAVATAWWTPERVARWQAAQPPPDAATAEQTA